MVAAVITQLERSKGGRYFGGLFAYWLYLVIAGALILYSKIRIAQELVCKAHHLGFIGDPPAVVLWRLQVDFIYHQKKNTLNNYSWSVGNWGLIPVNGTIDGTILRTLMLCSFIIFADLFARTYETMHKKYNTSHESIRLKRHYQGEQVCKMIDDLHWSNYIFSM